MCSPRRFKNKMALWTRTAENKDKQMDIGQKWKELCKVDAIAYQVLVCVSLSICVSVELIYHYVVRHLNRHIYVRVSLAGGVRKDHLQDQCIPTTLSHSV